MSRTFLISFLTFAVTFNLYEIYRLFVGVGLGELRYVELKVGENKTIRIDTKLIRKLRIIAIAFVLPALITYVTVMYAQYQDEVF